MKHGSLFSGIGGFDLAAQWMGWKNIFHCEKNKFGKKVLKHYWPNSISYDDITKTNFTIHRGSIDIVTGGFPCQPYSVAGKRKGKKDERHLWPEMLRAIREIQPRWIVGENVPGLIDWGRGVVLNEIKTDLENSGFEVFPALILPACGKNAPHRRDRLWVIAYADDNRCTSGPETNRDAHSVSSQDRAAIFTRQPHRADFLQPVTNSNRQGLQGSKINGSVATIEPHRNEQFAGFLQPTWENFPTQPAICGGNDGVSNRVDRIKALGNAVVPQLVYEIFKAIARFEVND